MQSMLNCKRLKDSRRKTAAYIIRLLFPYRGLRWNKITHVWNNVFAASWFAYLFNIIMLIMFLQ